MAISKSTRARKRRVSKKTRPARLRTVEDVRHGLSDKTKGNNCAVVLALLGARAAIQVAEAAAGSDNPIAFHLHRHALNPINEALHRLGWRR